MPILLETNSSTESKGQISCPGPRAPSRKTATKFTGWHVHLFRQKWKQTNLRRVQLWRRPIGAPAHWLSIKVGNFQALFLKIFKNIFGFLILQNFRISKFWVVCGLCQHGGHAECYARWFPRASRTCPYAECNCCCDPQGYWSTRFSSTTDIRSKIKFSIFRYDIGNGLYPATGHAQAAGNRDFIITKIGSVECFKRTQNKMLSMFSRISHWIDSTRR